MTSRRAFITGLISFVAAPAIVRASNLMQVKHMWDDGVALISMPHPWSDNLLETDLNENSLLQLMIEIRREFDHITGIRDLRGTLATFSSRQAGIQTINSTITQRL